jgi:hypothetical protein
LSKYLLHAATLVASTTLVAGCGGGGGKSKTPAADSSLQTPAPAAPAPPPPPAPTPVRLQMVFEATDTVVNLYSMNQCRRYGRNEPCTLPADLIKNTYVRVYTNSSALADNSLTLGEVTGTWIYMAVDSTATEWKPGWIELEMTTDASGLVATKFADGWRLYSSARVKAHTEKWCYANCDQSGYALTSDLRISSDWYQTLQVELNKYSGQTSIPDTRRYLFLTGPLIELPPAS